MITIYAGIGTPGEADFHSMAVDCAQIVSGDAYSQGPYRGSNWDYRSILREPQTFFSNNTNVIDGIATSAFDIYVELLGLTAGTDTCEDIPLDTVIDFYKDADGQEPMGFKMYIREQTATVLNIYIANPEFGMEFNALNATINKSTVIPDYSNFDHEETESKCSKFITFCIPYAYHTCTTWDEIFDQMFDDLTTNYDADDYSYMCQALEHVPLIFGCHITRRLYGGPYYTYSARQAPPDGCTQTPSASYRCVESGITRYSGLSTISAWYYFIKKEFVFNDINPIMHETWAFDLAEPVNGISEIVLGRAIYLTKDENGFLVNADHGYTEEGYGTAVREATPATNILALFDLNDPEVVKLKNGMEIEISGTSIQQTLTIRSVLTNKKIEFVWQNNGGTAFDSMGTGTGLFLVVPYTFANVSKDHWIDFMATYTSYTYGNAPIFPASFVGCPYERMPKSVEWDSETYPLGAPATFLTSYVLNPTTKIGILGIASNDDIPFWEELLENLHSDEPEPLPPYNPGTGSIGGGTTGSGGNDGDYDDDSDDVDPPAVPEHDGVALGAFNLYAMTKSTFKQFAKWFTDDFTTLADYLQYVETVQLVPLPDVHSALYANTDSNIIFVGDKDVAHGDITTWECQTQFTQADMGSISVSPYFGSFLDMSPYSKYQIYLPYVGIKDIPAEMIVGGTLTLSVVIDVVSGDLVYTGLTTIDGITANVFRWQGNCSIPIPLTAEDFRGKIALEKAQAQGALAMIGGGVEAVVGGVMSAKGMDDIGGRLIAQGARTFGSGFKELSESTEKIGQFVPSKVQSGSIGSTSGYMDVQFPYLIITRPKIAIPETFGKEHGFVSNISARIGDLKGYTEIESARLEGFTGASENELKAIERILTSGFIIK